MTWTKLDENFDQHPKVVAAGLLAELMHIHALIYCNRHLTNGFVSEYVIGRLLDRDQLADLSGDTPKTFAEVLVEIGLWDKVPGGYEIHDYLEYQPSRAAVLALREAKVRAGQAGGQASAQARAQADAQAKLKQNSSRSQAEGQAKFKPVSVSDSVSEGVINPSVGSPVDNSPVDNYRPRWGGNDLEGVGSILGRVHLGSAQPREATAR